MTADKIQQQLTDYASDLSFERISPEALHAAKVRIIDTFGALMGGFDGAPCEMGRRLAAASPMAGGATVIGTRIVTAPDMAAFANATTSRFVEANDVYRWPKSTGGHPSDVIMPLFAVSECARADGRAFITGVVLAYEIYCRISDCMDAWGKGVEPTNFARIAVAAAAARIWKLSRPQLWQAISMAAVAGNLVRQVRTGHLSMWKAVASGEAGRAGVFAAVLAREGMEGPSLPFEGKHGWCNDITRQPLEITTMGGEGVQFKVETTLIKPRTTCAATISSTLAAEKVAASLKGNFKDIAKVQVEVYQSAKEGMATGAHHWNPESRETADHSIPYVVAATLLDGTISPIQFDAAHIADPVLKAILAKVEVTANDEYTALYKKHPAEHHTRVTVSMANGQTITGEAGGDKGDLANPKTDGEIEEKFRRLTEGYLGAKAVSAILARLWDLENMKNVAQIAPAFVIPKQ